MLRADLDTLRLTLHILAATVWIGGQITLAGLVPIARPSGPDTVRALARRFNMIAWPAFAVLVGTGVWHLLAVDVGNRTTEYHVTLGVKLLMVGISGGGAAVHAVGRSKTTLAIGGAASLVGALVALVLGVMLRG